MKEKESIVAYMIMQVICGKEICLIIKKRKSFLKLAKEHCNLQP